MQAVPLSRSERGPGHEEIPEVKKRKLELPPSKVKRKEKEREKRKEQYKAERKEKKQRKAERREGVPTKVLPIEDFFLVGGDEAETAEADAADPGSAAPARQGVEWGKAVMTRTSITGMVTTIGLVTSPLSILGIRERSGRPRGRRLRGHQ